LLRRLSGRIGKSIDRLRQGRIAHRREHEPAPFGQAFRRRHVVATYVHNAVADGLGKLGVLVAVEVDRQQGCAHAIGRQVAMHIAATNPLALISTMSIRPPLPSASATIFIDQARESGKPENIIEKMVEGRMRKFYEEVAL
jgi:elongation factor Ts